VAAMQKEPLRLQISTDSKTGARILQLDGPLVLGNFFDFQQKLRKEEAPLTVIDLTAVPYMDSTGMGELINFYVHCQRLGNGLIIVAPNDRVIELFRLTRVDTLLTIVPSLAEAIA
jgi:anti-sigma B factor antagonist